MIGTWSEGWCEKTGANHVLFKDRIHAATLLAEKIAAHPRTNLRILGLARGGVVTASVIAGKLSVPFDVLVIKKLSGPGNPEFAIGAVTQDGVSLVEWNVAQRTGADESYVTREIDRLTREIRVQTRLYRKLKKPFVIEGANVILVDDGAATGKTLETAVRWAKKKKARTIVVGTPVASKEAVMMLAPEVDELIVCHEAASLEAVSDYYQSFPQITDEEVIAMLT